MLDRAGFTRVLAGIEAFLDYRLSMASAAGLVSDTAALRRDAAAALAALAALPVLALLAPATLPLPLAFDH